MNIDQGSESEAADLRAAITALKEDNEDLRASALRWIGLYEAALHRANVLEARLARPGETAGRPDGAVLPTAAA